MKLTLKQVCIETRKGFFKCRNTPYNQANKKMHWTENKKWTDAWHDAVLGAVIDSKQKRLYKKAVINIKLFKIQFFDHDGAYTAVKPVVDGLIHAGIIIDDAPKYIDLNVKQVKVFHLADEMVEVEILSKK